MVDASNTVPDGFQQGSSVLDDKMVELIIAARCVAYDDPPSADLLRDLDKALEPFAELVPWDDDPEREAQESAR